MSLKKLKKMLYKTQHQLDSISSSVFNKKRTKKIKGKKIHQLDSINSSTIEFYSNMLYIYIYPKHMSHDFLMKIQNPVQWKMWLCKNFSW